MMRRHAITLAYIATSGTTANTNNVALLAAYLVRQRSHSV
jgi:hypothetical protein